MTDEVKRMEKVFLALRTNFFDVEDEHVTLKYFKKATFAEVVYYASELSVYVPTEITLDGFANYRADQMFYEVAMVNWFKNPNLFEHTRFPHITIRKSNRPLSNATFVPEIYGASSEIIDQIHIGKKIKGKILWMPVDGRSIVNLQRNWYKETGENFEPEFQGLRSL